MQADSYEEGYYQKQQLGLQNFYTPRNLKYSLAYNDSNDFLLKRNHSKQKLSSESIYINTNNDSRIAICENNIKLLFEKFQNNEISLENELKKIVNANSVDRENIFKMERFVNMMNEQISLLTNELHNRTSHLNETINKIEKNQQENREKDSQLFNTVINNLSDKITDTFRREVEARYQADLDNKILIDNTSKKVRNDIDLIKGEIEKYNHSLNKTNQDSIERLKIAIKNHEKLFNGINDKVNSKIENFAEMLRKELDNKDLKERIDSMEIKNNEILRELTLAMNDLVQKNFENTSNSIHSLSKNVDKNIEILTKDIISTRNIISKKIDLIEETSKKELRIIIEDIVNLNEKFNKESEHNLKINEMNSDNLKEIKIFSDKIKNEFEIYKTNQSIVNEIKNNEIEKIKGFNNNLDNKIDELEKITISGLKIEFESNSKKIKILEEKIETFALNSEVEKTFKNMDDQVKILMKESEIHTKKLSDDSKIEKINNKIKNLELIFKNESKTYSERFESIDNDFSLMEKNIQDFEINFKMSEVIFKLDIDSIYELLKLTNSKISETTKSFVDKLTNIDETLKDIVNQNLSQTKKINEYNNVIDSKVNKICEKLKRDNLIMWINSIKEVQNMNSPAELKEILKKIPPVITPREESRKMMQDLKFIIEKNPRAKLVSPYHKLINYKEDFRYDVLNGIKPESNLDKTDHLNISFSDKNIEFKKENSIPKTKQPIEEKKINYKRNTILDMSSKKESDHPVMLKSKNTEKIPLDDDNLLTRKGKS